MWAFEALTKYYDNLVKSGKKVCPIAHTYLTAHFGVLIDLNGNFLDAIIPPISGEQIAVPCTIESESRTSNIAPHLISDQLQYIGNFPERNEEYKAYLKQLKHYLQDNEQDVYANAVYNYVHKGELRKDLAHILKRKTTIPIYKLNVIFCVYGLPNEGEDLLWTEYYTSKLKINGVCCVTGAKSHIPSNYPGCILNTSGKEKLFMKGVPVGYTSSQKIVHALQYMLYAKKNFDKIEAECKIHDYALGFISETEFKNWMDEKYSGRWDRFIKLLTKENRLINETQV